MSEARSFYEPFACAPALKLEAYERLNGLQIEAINARLDRIEKLIERLERRLWLAVFGVVSVILAQGINQLLNLNIGG